MTGEVFKGMHKLSSVSLSDNECIDEDFEEPLQVEVVRQKVNEKCGNDNFSTTTTTETYHRSNEKKKIKSLESKLRQAMIKIDDLEAELDDLKLKCVGI